MNGYLMVYRTFFDHWLWNEQRSLSKAEAFLDLLQFAAYAPTKRIIREKLIRLERGDMVASVRFLAERWKWGKDKVRTFLVMLEEDHMIQRETRQGETVLTLCNYERYARAPDTDPTVDPTPNQTEARQRPDKEEEDKEGEEGEEERGHPPPDDPSPHSPAEREGPPDEQEVIDHAHSLGVQDVPKAWLSSFARSFWAVWQERDWRPQAGHRLDRGQKWKHRLKGDIETAVRNGEHKRTNGNRTNRRPGKDAQNPRAQGSPRPAGDGIEVKSL